MDIKETIHGAIIVVYAQPGARAASAKLFRDGIKIAVTEKAQKGAANQAIIDFVRDRTGLKKSDIQIIRGHGARKKTMLLSGLSLCDAEYRLKQIIK